MTETKKQKVIAITGGATGIGRATVLKFLAEGYSVAFCDINEPEVEKLLALPEVVAASAQDRVFYQHVDTKERAAIKSWVNAAIAKFDHLDAVFANAGIHRSNTMLGISDEELQLVINTNIYGTVYTLQETVPYLIENGTKGALGQITRSLAIDLGPKNVRVNAVCPATIHTPLADGAMGRYAQRAGLTLEQAWAEEDTLYPLGRSGEPEEVAAMVFFLVDQGSFCTGGHYLVDGGLVAHS